jgi:hypothetical protein
MVFELRMASILSGRQGRLAPAQRPDCCWTTILSMIFPEESVSAFPDHALAHDRLSKIESPLFFAEDHAKTRANQRARELGD